MTRLDGVHPTLAAKITQVLASMAALGHPMFVAQGVRTTAQQQALYAQGRTVPGTHVVTNCDGVTSRSNHQVHSDGLGHAVDCAFSTGDAFGDNQPWSLYGTCCRAVGLVWGGTFHSIVDRPHAELPPPGPILAA